MRNVSPTLLTYLARPGSFRIEVLFEVVTKDRTTGATQTVGFWTGDTNENITVGGVSRLFYGAGTMLSAPDISYETGLNVTSVDVVFSSLSPEFESAVRVYDVRQQPANLYQAFIDTDTELLIEAPTRIFKGRVNTLDIMISETDGQSSQATVNIASSARALTRTMPRNKSADAYLVRSGDEIGKYSTISGAIPVAWGRSSV